MKKSGFNRRGFLKSSLMGTAGLVIGTGVKAAGVQNKKELPVIKRQLGKTDIVLPVVSFGVMRSDNAALVKSAFEMGFVHFDTAHGYQEGKNETMLGEIFKDIPRNKFVIATKVGADGIDRATGEPGAATTKEGIISKFETSLQRLQVKYVDILYLHGVFNKNTVLAPQLLEAFSQLKKEGKVRYVGISTHKNEPEMIQAAIDSNFYNVVLTSINYKHSLAAQIKEKAAIAADKGIGIVAMKTMAGGFMDKERTKPVNCSAALKWVLQDPNIHTSIPGIVSYDQMIQNFSVMENLEFTQQEKDDLKSSGLISGLYCDGCSDCQTMCVKHLPVHDYMRAYMYAYGYRMPQYAYSVLRENNHAIDPCAGCKSCTVECRKGFQISERITDITRLSHIPADLLG